MNTLINKTEIVKLNDISSGKLIPSEKDTIAILLAMLESLSYRVCSEDLWWLATRSARDISIEKYGLSKEIFNEVMERFEKVRSVKKSENPMASMF